MSTANKFTERTINEKQVFKHKPIKKLLVSKEVPKVLCHFQRANAKSGPTTRSVECAQPQSQNPEVRKRGHTTLTNATTSKITQKTDISTTVTASKDTVANSVKLNQQIAPKSSVHLHHSRGTVPKLSNLSLNSTDQYPLVLNPRSGDVEQFYKNENFANTPHSLTRTDKKSPLGNISRSLHAAASETEFRNLQQFRDDNYLECHSAISRTKSKASAIDLPGHKCSYRFYINDRLFPTPLNSDARTLRCIQCHLPFDESRQEDSLNGIIQGKVNIEGEIKDVMMLLPVERPVVIRERRLEREGKKDVVYFGVIKLGGHVGCKPAALGDSLALRYQKGFQWRGDARVTERGDACDIVFV